MAITQIEFDSIVNQIEALLIQPLPQGKILNTETPITINLITVDESSVLAVFANPKTSLSFNLPLWHSNAGEPMGFFYNTRYSAIAMLRHFLEHISNQTVFNEPININDESFDKFETAVVH
jgi:hypothetical protein